MYLCACSTVTFVVLAIANFNDISFLRERGKCISLKDLLKGISGKTINKMKLFYCLKSVTMCKSVSKRSFQRYINQLGSFRKNLRINSVSLSEDVQQNLEEHRSSH